MGIGPVRERRAREDVGERRGRRERLEAGATVGQSRAADIDVASDNGDRAALPGDEDPGVRARREREDLRLDGQEQATGGIRS